MAVIGTLVAKLNMDSRGFSRGAQKAQGDMGRLSGSISKVSTLAVAAGAAAVAGIGAVGGLGIKLVAEAEQAEVAFTTMLGSAEAAKKMLVDLKTFAASTPFQLGELRDSARQLMAFGVAGENVLPLMKTMGDLAAGTQKPIGDFVDIFGKVKASGIAALGDINRLADRGVPIYTALAETMGVAEGDIRWLASSGKIGLAELQKALESVVGAGGLFENSMEKQSKTLSGIWSTLKDNVLFVIEDIARAFVDGFNLKGILSDGIGGIQSMKEVIAGIVPFIKQWARAVRAEFDMMIEFAGMIASSFSSAFSAIADYAGVSFTDITDLAMKFLVAMEYGFTNWDKIAGIVITSVMLKAVKMFNEFTHFFTGVLPALLSGFTDNWGNTFRTAADYVMTVFINIGQNIRNVMGSVWDYIASGGKKELSLAWVPLTEGFHNSIKQIKIPDRVKSQLEMSLQNELDSLNNEVATGFQQLLDERMAPMQDGGKEPAKKKKPPELPTMESSQGGKSGSVTAKQKGTTEAFSAIIGAKNNYENKLLENAKKANVIAEQQLDALNDLVEGSGNQPPVVSLGAYA